MRRSLPGGALSSVDLAARAAEASPDILYVYDVIDHRLIYANHNLATYLGYPAETARAPMRRLLELIMHPDDRRHYGDWIKVHGRATNGEINEFEFRLKRRGQWRWFRTRVSVLTREADGQPRYVVGSARDVTEQRLTEESLRHSEQRYRLLVEAAEDGIVLTDMSGRLVYANPAYHQALGYGPDEPIDPDVFARIHPDDVPTVRARLEDLRAGRAIDPVEYRVRLKSGRWGYRSTRVVALPGHVETPPRLLAMVRDVTGRRRLEQLLGRTAMGVSAQTGTGFFRSLVTYLARTLGTGHAFVATVQRDDDGGDTMRTIACFANGRIIDNFTYRPAVKPAEGLLCRCPENARTLLPDEAMLHAMGVSSCRGEPLCDAHGNCYGVVAVLNGEFLDEPSPVSDLLKIFAARAHAELERMGIEATLEKQKERAQVTLESIGDAVITAEADGRIDYLNPLAAQQTGWPAEDAKGRQVDDVFRLKGDKSAGRNRARTHRAPSDEILVARSGEELPIRYSRARIRDRGGKLTGEVVVFHDVSEQRALRERLFHQATHDPLTDLANRREFEFRLEQLQQSAQARAEQHAVLYIDLDQFKVVNDTCGHAAGDELLKQVAAVITASVRDLDTVARLGGDEFGALVEHCDAAQAERIAEGICEEVGDFRFAWEEKTFHVGASIGVVPVTAAWANATEILAAADMACYAAKERGRGRVHLYQEGDVDLAQRHGEIHWVTQINQAMAASAFQLHCQIIAPARQMAGSSERHCEVLLRMRDQSGALVLPGSFIPAAERYHLMPRIDRWVVERVFQYIAQRRRGQHPDAPFSAADHFAINLSGTSLSDHELLNFIRSRLNTYEVDPRQICFEITETAAIAHLGTAMNLMSELKQLGCTFALDDFGSGVSSFSYLKALQVDYLKIDGSFVRGLARDPFDQAMVEAINRIGQVAGVQTVAEWVEDQATLQRLAQMGVDYVQGFAIGRPLPMVRT